MVKRLTLVAAADLEPLRIDRWLARQIPGLGRRGAVRWLQEGQVELDGRRALKSDLVRPAATVTVAADPLTWPSPGLQPEPGLELKVVLETDGLVIVDKPAGMPSVALRGRPVGSLAAALVARYPEMQGLGYGPLDAGLLHRLDTETSGLVIAARTRAAFDALRAALHREQIDKRYLAIVPGRPDRLAGSIELPLRPHRKNRRKVEICDKAAPGARHAKTEYQLLERGDGWALLEVRAPRAYRHQVRAHLAHLGLPLAGDVLYGGQPEPVLGQRHALHAHYAAWRGEGEIGGFRVRAELPSAFARLLRG